MYIGWYVQSPPPKGRRGGFCWREWTMSFTAGRPAVSGQLMRRPPRPWRDDDGRP